MKLPRLQLHLSTMLIVSLLAAGFMWKGPQFHLSRDEIYA